MGAAQAPGFGPQEGGFQQDALAPGFGPPGQEDGRAVGIYGAQVPPFGPKQETSEGGPNLNPDPAHARQGRPRHHHERRMAPDFGPKRGVEEGALINSGGRQGGLPQLLCPKGHALQNLPGKRWGFCDVCYQPIAWGEDAWSCMACNWSMCQRCSTQSTPTQERRQGLTLHMRIYHEVGLATEWICDSLFRFQNHVTHCEEGLAQLWDDFKHIFPTKWWVLGLHIAIVVAALIATYLRSMTEVEDFNEGFRSAAGLKVAIPYYLLFVLADMKPVLFVFLFGTPRTKGASTVRDVVNTSLCFGVALMCVVSDANKLLRGFMLEGLSPWARLNVLLAIVALSPNICTLWTLIGMLTFYNEDLPEVKKSRGELWLWFYKVMAFLYELLSRCLVLWALPAMVAYLWLVLPVFILQDWVARMPLPILAKKLKELKAKPQSQAPLLGSNDADAAAAERQAAWGMYNYFWYPLMIGPGFMLLFPVTARLYSGCGYWQSLVSTLDDRSFGAWFTALTSKADVLIADAWLRMSNTLI